MPLPQLVMQINLALRTAGRVSLTASKLTVVRLLRASFSKLEGMSVAFGGKDSDRPSCSDDGASFCCLWFRPVTCTGADAYPKLVAEVENSQC